MSSRKQQALDRLLDVSGPGCFNEVTGTWMVGRRHHHHHQRHVAPPPPPQSAPESAPESTPEPETSGPSSTLKATQLLQPSQFYPTWPLPGRFGGGRIMAVGDRFNSTYIFPNYPSTLNYRPGTIRRSYIVTSRTRQIGRLGEWYFSYTISYIPPSPSSTYARK